MPCCSSPGPAYKQRVDLVFSSSGSTAQTPALSANIDAGAVTKLLYYANVNSDKLPQIARELERRIAKELGKKRFALAVCGAFALSELLKSCHRDLRLFYAHVAATIKSLLACVASREIQLVGVDLFATFAALPTRVLPPPSDADAFVREFVRMASSMPESSSSSTSSTVAAAPTVAVSPPVAAVSSAAPPLDLPAPFTPTTARHARVAGLRGIRAYLPLLDELPSRLSDDALRILPSIFDNFRLTGPAASGPVPRTPLSPEHTKDDGSADDAAAAPAAAAAASSDDGADPDDPDASPSVRALARQCLRELVVRTSTTNIKSLVEAALDYVDANGLWGADAGGEFSRELFATICGTLKPHDYQTALDSLLAKITAVPDIAHKTRVVETLHHCLRSGMLTVHQLVRTLLQQLVDSLKAAFGGAKNGAAHAELNRALVACVVELGRVVEQPKRLDTLSGIVRQLKALEGVLSKAAQRCAANALLVRAFADVAAHLKPLAAADNVQLASAYDALLVVAAAPASGDERVACALATIDAMRALVAAAPPRTDDDDDRDGHRFATTAGGGGGGAGGAAALVSSGAGGSAAGEGGSAIEGGVGGAATDIKKRAARARRGTGGVRELGVLGGGGGASVFVENHAHVLSALDVFLFPDEACGTAALSALVAAGGSLLLAALAAYGVGEALRTLPFVFSLQQRALDLPDEARPAAKKSRKSSAAVAAAAGLEVAPPIADPSAVHALVGTYMTALAELLDSDELRATVTHTLSQRSKQKQRSLYVAADAACLELTFSERGATKKALAAAKRITLTFERAGVVSVLTRDKQLQQFDVLGARLALEWVRTGAVGAKFPASSRLNRLGSVHTVASARGALHATESDRDLRAGGAAAGSEAARAALASYPHNAPPATEPSAKLLADANIDVNAFLAVLRGDAVVDDDDALLGNVDDDDDSLHRSGASDGEVNRDDDDIDVDVDDDDMMQVSDSEARSEISIDDEVDKSSKKKSKKGAKKKAGAKEKKKTKAKKRRGGGAKQRVSTVSNPAPIAPGTEQWRAQVSRLRERSFEEVSAVSARAQERAVRETAVAAFGFDSEAFVDDEVADPLPTHHNWHVATTLPGLLQKLDAEFTRGNEPLPHLRDDFACGALVVR